MRKREIYIPKPFIGGLLLIIAGGLLLSSSGYVRALMGLGQSRMNGPVGGSHAIRQPAANVAPGNLVAHYPLDGDAKDAAATSGNHLTDNNTVTQASTKTNAAEFVSANSEYLSITDNAATSTGDIDFTLAAWVYPTSVTGTQAIASKYGATGAGTSEYILRRTGTAFSFLVSGGSTVGNIASSTVTVATNHWYFVVGWHDATNDTINIQVNNLTVNSDGHSAGSNDSGTDFNMGRRGNGSEYFDGRIDAFGFWKRTLTSAERTKLYNGGSGLTYSQLQAASLTTNLNAYWELNELSGTRNDAASTNHLTDNATVTSNTGITGIATGNAAQFTAANSEYLSRSDSADVSTGDIDFTLAGWAYFDSLGNRNIIGKNTSGTYEYNLVLADTNLFRFYGSGNGSNNAQFDLSATAFGAAKLNTWYYVVAWHDSVNNTVNLQINNGTIFSASWSGGVFDSTSSLDIGRESGSRFMDGRTDAVGFWKRLLTADERTALYNNGFGRMYRDLSAPLKSNLVSYWDMEEASGTRNDAHLHGQNHGTISGTVTPSTTAKFGQAYSFDGIAGSRIAIPSTSLGTTHTISFWLYYTDGGDGVIIGNTSGNGYGAYVDSSNASTGKIYYNTGGSNLVSVNHNGLTGPAWAYFTIVRNGTSVDFYKNGVQLSTTQTLGANTALTVGAIGDYSNGGFPTAMNLDDLRIYNTNLSATQIADLYGGSKAPACDQTCVGWWKLDETSGQTVTDSSPQGNNGTLGTNSGVGSDDPIVGVGGIYNAGASFDGGDFMDIGTGSSLKFTTAPFTLSAWVRPSSLSGSMNIMGTDNATDGYALLIVGSGTVRFTTRGTTQNLLDSPSTITANTWTHIAVVYSGTNGNRIMYINGLAVATDTISGSIVTNTGRFSIGQRSDNANRFLGLMDDLRVYNRVLQPYEIHEQYLAGK